MFITADDRNGGETKISSTSQIKPSRFWVLLVMPGPILHACVSGELGCMQDAHFELLSLVLDEVPSKIRTQFVRVSETKKPQVLKIGKEKDMRMLRDSILFFACTCLFTFEVARSL